MYQKNGFFCIQIFITVLKYKGCNCDKIDCRNLIKNKELKKMEKEMNIYEEIEKLALETGAKMIGIAPADRFKDAPDVYKPESFIPGAKNVIVVGVHYPDACVEFCGNSDPQKMGAYGITQVDMNVLLDMLSFRITKLLDKHGYPAVSFSTSHIWRYDPFDEIDRCFTPDFSHRHAAVAAGLGEFGWNGLVINEKYGARVRFNSIITTAELPATPMYDGPALCDKCMKCVTSCPMDTFRKEVDGMDEFSIGGRDFKFPHTNKWRCAWAEHFALDLKMDIPDKIDAKSVLNAKHTSGVYGGEMGNCLRHCMPEPLRTKRTDQTEVFQRKKIDPKTPKELLNNLKQKIGGKMEYFASIPVSKLPTEINHNILPDAKSIILIGSAFTKDLPDVEVYKHIGNLPDNINDAYVFAKEETYRLVGVSGLETAMIAEEYGYEAMPRTEVSPERLAAICELGEFSGDGRVFQTPEFASNQVFAAILTTADLPFYVQKPTTDIEDSLERNELESISKAQGADLFGITSLERLSEFSSIKQLKQLYPNAKNAIVIGMHYPDAYLEECKGASMEALGPYSFSQYQVHRELGFIALDICKKLSASGNLGIPLLDLCQTASKQLNVRGTPPAGTQMDRGMIGLLPFAFIPDCRSNRFAAISSGLGVLGHNGLVLTQEYGPRQRFICILTDSDLAQDDIKDFDPGCNDCELCLTACPTKAFSESQKTEFKIGDKKFIAPFLDQARCDWAMRFGLSGEEGPKYMGSSTDIAPPAQITLEEISKAFEQRDPLQDHFVSIMEPCVKVCPAPFEKLKE